MAVKNGYFTGSYRAGTRNNTSGKAIPVDFYYGDRKPINAGKGTVADFFYGFRASRTLQGYYLPSPLHVGYKKITTRCGYLTRGFNVGSRKSVKSGYLTRGFNPGTRKPPKRIGTYLNAENVGKRTRSSQGFLIGYKVGSRKSVKIGIYLQAYRFDSNISGSIDLLVTPTVTYDGSPILVQSTIKNPITGKFALYVDNTLVIPPADSSSDISNRSFQMDLTKLAVGDNKCRLEYYPDGATKSFVKFVVAYEALARSVSQRTFHKYTGGFDKDPSIEYIVGEDAFEALYPNANSIIQTSDKTAVPLRYNTGIMGANVSGVGSLFYVSFDRRATWYSFIGGVWTVCNPADIRTKGMNRATLAAITRAQWAAIYQKTQLDFMCLLDSNIETAKNQNSVAFETSLTATGASLPGASYIVPDGTVVTGFNALNRGAYGFTTIIYDRAGNVLQNKITGAGSSYNYTHPVGAPQIGKLVILDTVGVGYAGMTIYQAAPCRAYLNNVTVLLPPNMPPEITSVSLTPLTLHSENAVLTAHIKDPDGDFAQYRVLVNGEVIKDYSNDPAGSEYDISVNIPNDKLIVGTNAITIQTYDGSVYSTPYTTYLTKVDAKPVVFGILDKLDFTAVLSDDDAGDTIRYRLLLNGVVKVDWTSFALPPVNVAYKILQRDVILGRQNTLKLEVQDNLGVITTVDFDFVGKNYASKYVLII